MNNEIIEILDIIYKVVSFGYCPFFIKKLGYREFYKLKDYLINLEKENKDLKNLLRGVYNEKY